LIFFYSLISGEVALGGCTRAGELTPPVEQPVADLQAEEQSVRPAGGRRVDAVHRRHPLLGGDPGEAGDLVLDALGLLVSLFSRGFVPVRDEQGRRPGDRAPRRREPTGRNAQKRRSKKQHQKKEMPKKEKRTNKMLSLRFGEMDPMSETT